MPATAGHNRSVVRTITPLNRIQNLLRLPLLTLLLMLFGCSAGHPNSCKGVLGTQPYLTIGRDYDEGYYRTASESWLQAMLAANAYDPAGAGRFKLPETVSERAFFDPGRGLQAKLYAIGAEQGQPHKLVIAFRGTTSLYDWLFGNLLNSQYALADTLVAAIRQQYPTVELIATGHSLGGGLALHVSMVFDGVSAYAFNPSYKVLSPPIPKMNRRVVVGASGDILALQRRFWFQPEVDVDHPAYNCTHVNQHDITLLSRCLLHVAAAGEQRAQLTLAQNRSPLCGSLGWISLGPRRDQQRLIEQFRQTGSAAVTLAAEAYLRRDPPQPPFYRLAGAIRVIPAGTTLSVLDLIDSVGWRQRSWIKVAYDPVETSSETNVESIETTQGEEGNLNSLAPPVSASESSAAEIPTDAVEQR